MDKKAQITPAICESLTKLIAASFQDLGALEAVVTCFGLMGRVDMTVMTKASPKQVVKTKYISLASKDAQKDIDEAIEYLHSLAPVTTIKLAV